ncbi:MAG: FAD/NAD(P)-binding protein [Candidatus Competibacteraceae bacterium]
MLPIPYRIHKMRRELADVYSRSVPESGTHTLNFAPGQFNMIYAFGSGEVPISISGDPAVAPTLVHTIRAVGPVTRAMQGLKKGDTLGIRGPFGTAWPVIEAGGSDVVIVTGGVGLAPLRPAIYHILAHREKYGNVRLYYGARTPADILFLKEPRNGGRFDMIVEVTVDSAIGYWAGRVGVVTHLVSRGRYDPVDTVALVCGPEIMMRYTIKALNERGVANDQIYVSMERNMKCAIGFAVIVVSSSVLRLQGRARVPLRSHCPPLRAPGVITWPLPVNPN